MPRFHKLRFEVSTEKGQPNEHKRVRRRVSRACKSIINDDMRPRKKHIHRHAGERNRSPTSRADGAIDAALQIDYDELDAVREGSRQLQNAGVFCVRRSF